MAGAEEDGESVKATRVNEEGSPAPPATVGGNNSMSAVA